MWDELQRFAELPQWLRDLNDSDRLRTAFSRSIPELSSGSLFLHEVRLERSRNKKGVWNVYYRVRAGAPHAEPKEYTLKGILHPPGSDGVEPVASSVGFGAPGWSGAVPELGLSLEVDDPEQGLPAFAQLTNPTEARAILERGIREDSPYKDIQIEGCKPNVVRYKAGSRCTILYTLDYGPEKRDERWPDMVAVKTYYAHKGLNAWNGMRALWESRLRDDPDLTIAEPLSFTPESNILIQGPVQEDYSVKDLLIRAFSTRSDEAINELRGVLQATAAGLAALHGCGVIYGDEVTWKDEITEVRDIVGRITGAVPGIDEAAEPILRRLEELADAHPPEAPLPCHRSFRPAQVLVHDGRVGFIDFDGFCHAERALDIALFRATIKYLGLGEAMPRGAQDLANRTALEEQLSLLDDACDLFLDAYERRATISRERVVLWETLYILTYVLHCWTKVHPERLQGSMLMLEQHVRERVNGLR